MTIEAPRTTQRRIAGAVLAAAAIAFLLCEFIAAAAWRDPPYSYTYHYISDLGVRGPLVAMDQHMNSPLSWVMNTGFFLFGTLVFTGVALLDGLQGRRRVAVVVLAALVGSGGVVLALFPGDGEADRLGTVDYHGFGAMAAIIGGNILIIVLGRLHRHLGIPQKRAKTMVVLGVVGLVMTIAFITVAGSGANVLIGLVQRCAVYPFLFGLSYAGTTIYQRGLRDLHHLPAQDAAFVEGAVR